MERERKRLRLPVEVDDDGFSIDEARLDESLKDRIDELATEKVKKQKTGLRLFLGSILGIFLMGAITVLVMRGAMLLAFILIVVSIFNVGDFVKWIENSNE